MLSRFLPQSRPSGTICASFHSGKTVKDGEDPVRDHTSQQVKSPVRDVPQWIVAIAKDGAREEIGRFVECMQETVQQHLDSQALAQFYENLKQDE